jgi:hypothetical protein
VHSKYARGTERPTGISRFPKIFGERFRQARRISSFSRVVGVAHHVPRDIKEIDAALNEKPMADEAAVTRAAASKATNKSQLKAPALPPRDILTVAPVPINANVKVATTESLVGTTEQLVNTGPVPERIARLRSTKWFHHSKPAVSVTNSISAGKPATSLASTVVVTKVAATTITAESNYENKPTHSDQITPFTATPEKLKELSSFIRKPALEPASENASFHNFHQISALFDDDEYEDVETESDQQERDEILRSVQVPTKIGAIEKALDTAASDADSGKKKYKIHYGRRLAQKLKAATVTNSQGQTDLGSGILTVTSPKSGITITGPLEIHDAESHKVVQNTDQKPDYDPKANENEIAGINL